MSFRRSILVLATVVVAATSVAGCRQPPAHLLAERLDALMTVLPDGSLEVEEQWRVRTDDGAAARFRRYMPDVRHDGVFDVQFTVDGTPSPAGTDPGQGARSKGRAFDVEWSTSPGASSQHTLGLRYRLAGAVAVSGIRGELSAQLLAPRDFEIDFAAIAVKLPPGAVLLGDPWVEEAGWDVERRADGMFASRRIIGRGESATPGATFTIDTMKAGEPSWQYFQRRSRDLMPAFISGGLFILVIGAGVVGMVRMKYRPWPVRQTEGETSALAPDLERAIRTEKYDAAVLPRLVSAGLIDAERMQVARDLRRAAVATVVFGAVCWLFTSLTFSHLGPWPSAIPIGILVSGVMFAVAGRRFSILNQAGVDARERMLYSARIRGGPTSA